MSSIPTSAMPRAVTQEPDDGLSIEGAAVGPTTTEETGTTDASKTDGTGAMTHIVRIVTAPAIITLGLTAMAVSAVAEILAAKGSPVTAPSDQVPI